MEPQPRPRWEAARSDRAQDSDFFSPRKKRPRGAFTPNEKNIILNIYKYNIENWPRTTECAKKTSEITGIGLSSVYKITKDYNDTKDFQKPKKSGPQLSFIQKFDEFTFATIRRKVHAFFYRNEIQTIEKIHQEIAGDPDMSVMSKSTLRKVLKHLNFKYASRKLRSALTDRKEIVLWRQKYLHRIKQYRREGRFI